MNIPKQLSPGEATFALHCKAYGLDPLREFTFCIGRKWRLDFYFPDHKIAVEVEGGTRMNGRHQRHEGFQNDARKYNEAAAMGIKVFRFTTAMVKSGECIDFVMRVLKLAQ